MLSRICIILCLLAYCWAGGKDKVDYCKLCPNKTHVGCNHNGLFDKSCPSDAKMVDMTRKLKDFILDIHNEKRQLIAGGSLQPFKPACRMIRMVWGQFLDEGAVFNVKQCQMKHDLCRNTPYYHNCGQNLAIMQADGKLSVRDMIAKSIDNWFNEYKNANISHMESYPKEKLEKPIGHFTLMVAEKNARIGCAAATYTDKTTNKSTFLMACNYATTNIVGAPVYTACDKPTMNCVKGKSDDYNKLCSYAERYVVGEKRLKLYE